ncbi:hypothetical protein DINM_004948 [Dirofilaria immitis]|nr:hypothetical protein [Dirofilaria immitis]
MGHLFMLYLLQLQMMLLIGVKVIRIGGNENTRVISIVEQFEDDTLWEFHSKSVRRAQNKHVDWKLKRCRIKSERLSELGRNGFPQSLRLKLLPGLTTNDALSYEDAIMLSNVDSRLLSPEPESLCKIGIIDDSDQIEIAEKSRFEDTLISRLFRKEIRDLEQGNSEH